MFADRKENSPMSRTKAKYLSTTKPKTEPKTEPRKYLSAAEKAPDVPRVAYTIPEFCASHRLSLSMYYKMRVAGKGPRESHAGSKVIITLPNAAAWLKQIEEVEAS